MFETIKINIVNPLITRVGTATGVLLADFGLTGANGLGEQIAAGAGALILVALEVVLRRMWAKR